METPSEARDLFCAQTGTTPVVYAIHLPLAIDRASDRFSAATTHLPAPLLSSSEVSHALLLEFHSVSIMVFSSPICASDTPQLRLLSALHFAHIFFAHIYGPTFASAILILRQRLEAVFYQFKALPIDRVVHEINDSFNRIRLLRLAFHTTDTDFLDPANDDYTIDCPADAFYNALTFDDDTVHRLLLQMSYGHAISPPTRRSPRPQPSPPPLGTKPNSPATRKAAWEAKPFLKGRHPCFAWIKQKAPCNGPTCKLPKMFPHTWDPADSPAVQKAFADWILAQP